MKTPTLGKRIRDYRIPKHFTQRQFAVLAGVSRRTIQFIERGGVPREITANKVEAALKN
jgi:transcriptional regulator with XRE-family HTH domain